MLSFDGRAALRMWVNGPLGIGSMVGSVWQLGIDGCATFRCGWMVRSGIGSMDGQGLATWLVDAVIPTQIGVDT